MIPCIATVQYNRRDLTQRMVASIDYPVRHLLLVDNGVEGISDIKLPGYVMEAHQIWNGNNLGCAGGWNQILHRAFVENQFPAVLVPGNDIQWTPGDLAKFDQALKDNPDAEWLFGNWSFSTWMCTLKGFQNFGWFDEGYDKGYLEDSDAWRRINLTGQKVVSVDTHAIHGEAPTWGSSTIYSDPAMKRVVEDAHSRNWKYHCSKWGGRIKGNTERFLTPFDDVNHPVNYWKLTEQRMKDSPFFRSEG